MLGPWALGPQGAQGPKAKVMRLGGVRVRWFSVGLLGFGTLGLRGAQGPNEKLTRLGRALGPLGFGLGGLVLGPGALGS